MSVPYQCLSISDEQISIVLVCKANQFYVMIHISEFIEPSKILTFCLVVTVGGPVQVMGGNFLL